MQVIYRPDKPEILWKGGPAPVYVLWGAEEELKEQALRKLLGQLLDPDFRDFNLEELHADSAGPGEILAAAGQVSFGDSRRVVVVHGADGWRDRGRAPAAEALAARLGALPDNACLIVMVGAGDEEERRKTVFSASADSAFDSTGIIVRCDTLRGAALSEWVRGRAADYGKGIGGAVIDALISAAGADLRGLEQQIAKLAAHSGTSPEILSSDVSAVVTQNPEDRMFATIDMICRGDVDGALLGLAELHRLEPKPQAVSGKLLALLTRQYRLIWQARAMLRRGLGARDLRSLPADAAEDLPKEGSLLQVQFRAGEYFAQARNYTAPELRDVFQLLLSCDAANKGGATEVDVFGGDPAINLQLLTIQLALLAKR